jgi:hypothetical protein
MSSWTQTFSSKIEGLKETIDWLRADVARAPAAVEGENSDGWAALQAPQRIEVMRAQPSLLL